MTIEPEGDGRGPPFVHVVCAWCKVSIGPPAPGEPSKTSHGICLKCLPRHFSVPLVRLGDATPGELEALPWGVVRLTGEGIVTAYTAAESALSGRDPARVVGRHFFKDVAPCTHVKNFEGRLTAFRAAREDARAKFRFVFEFPRGALLVNVALVYDAARDEATLMIEKAVEQA